MGVVVVAVFDSGFPALLPDRVEVIAVGLHLLQRLGDGKGKY